MSSAPRNPRRRGAQRPAALPDAMLAARPLAERMRPRTTTEFVGQSHLLGAGQAPACRDRARRAAFADPVGPARHRQDHAGAADRRAQRRPVHRALGGAGRNQGYPRGGRAGAREAAAAGQRTVLFLDEVHRFNKAQQDAFLPHVEDGTLIFIGATTENPSFEIIGALLSRARVYVLRPLEARRAACADGPRARRSGARARNPAAHDRSGGGRAARARRRRRRAPGAEPARARCGTGGRDRGLR